MKGYDLTTEEFFETDYSKLTESLMDIKKDGLKLILEVGDIRYRENRSYSNAKYSSGFDWIHGVVEDSKYDFIFGEIPFGLRKKKLETPDGSFSFNEEFVHIWEALKFLKEDGIAAFTFMPSLFSLTDGMRFRDFLNERDFFINAVFRTHDHVMTQNTSIVPILVVISKEDDQNLFIADIIEKGTSIEVAENFKNRVNGKHIEKGVFTDPQKFDGFEKYYVRQQIEKLESQYKEYEEKSLSDLVDEINYVRSGQSFEPKENAIYFPKIGNSPVVSSLEKLTIKENNYFQIVVNNIVRSEFLALFFKSDLGDLVRKQL